MHGDALAVTVYGEFGIESGLGHLFGAWVVGDSDGGIESMWFWGA